MRAFKTALQKHGLVFDLNVPTNVACILRPLGSVNRKYDPPRVARLAFSGPDCDLEAIQSALAHVQPEVEREQSRDRNNDADFDEIVDAVEYLATRGHFDAGRYEQMLALHFALAHLVSVKPELRGDAWGLIRCVVAGTGRDLSINESRFEDALTRTADRLAADGDLVTPASLFRAAYASGWRASDALNNDQRVALANARHKLRVLFSKPCKRATVERLIDRIGDARVRAATAPQLAIRATRAGWAESDIIDAVERLTGRRDSSIVRWAQRESAI